MSCCVPHLVGPSLLVSALLMLCRLVSCLLESRHLCACHVSLRVVASLSSRCALVSRVMSRLMSRHVVSRAASSLLVSFHVSCRVMLHSVWCAGVISRLVSSFSAECDVVLDVIYIYLGSMPGKAQAPFCREVIAFEFLQSVLLLKNILRHTHPQNDATQGRSFQPTFSVSSHCNVPGPLLSGEPLFYVIKKFLPKHLPNQSKPNPFPCCLLIGQGNQALTVTRILPRTFPGTPPNQTRTLRCSGKPHLRLTGTNLSMRRSHSLGIPAHTDQIICACGSTLLLPLQSLLFSGCCLHQQGWPNMSLGCTRDAKSKSPASASDPVMVWASLHAQIKSSAHAEARCSCLCSLSCSAAAASTNRLGQTCR